MAAGPGGVGQQWREPLYPPVDRDVVDLDAAFGEELFDVAVGQAEAQIPADGEDDDVAWESGSRQRRTAQRKQGEGGGGFSCQQCRCFDAVAADATVPPDVVMASGQFVYPVAGISGRASGRPGGPLAAMPLGAANLSGAGLDEDGACTEPTGTCRPEDAWWSWPAGVVS